MENRINGDILLADIAGEHILGGFSFPLHNSR